MESSIKRLIIHVLLLLPVSRDPIYQCPSSGEHAEEDNS